MRYSVHYLARNHYEHPVQEAVLDFLVTPTETPGQRLLGRQSDPRFPGKAYSYTNIFGFEVIRFRAEQPFADCEFSFSFQVESDVQTEALPLAFFPLEEELAIMDSPEFSIDHILFLRPTPSSRLDESQNFFPYQRNISVFDYLLSLRDHIYEAIRFEPGITHVHTTAEEVLAIRRGVCQDFVHLFLAIARQSGIPCRYVSGYLDQGMQFQGAAQMHAWAEAMIPGRGWVGFDPTNKLLADHHFIKVSHGCDYQDCAPLRGIIYMGGGQRTEYEVVVKPENSLVNV
ncbi:MAG: transglutaminase family protein [Bacteroidetes bacterium]|nr:MAG: transglutaminase family protein [Bacteroidota bacterium]